METPSSESASKPAGLSPERELEIRYRVGLAFCDYLRNIIDSGTHRIPKARQLLASMQRLLSEYESQGLQRC